jgi:hypothetical protein
MAEETWPSGWYPDPEGVAYRRYWTGERWSGLTRAEEQFTEAPDPGEDGEIYTEDDLLAMAFADLRAIGAELGVRGRSRTELVERIMETGEPVEIAEP